MRPSRRTFLAGAAAALGAASGAGWAALTRSLERRWSAGGSDRGPYGHVSHIRGEIVGASRTQGHRLLDPSLLRSHPPPHAPPRPASDPTAIPPSARAIAASPARSDTSPARTPAAPDKPPIAAHMLHRSNAVSLQAAQDRAGPASREAREVEVVICGAGVAGLSAAWALARAGVHDVVLLELEPRVGGTASSGAFAASAFPWGAHYVPIPTRESRAVRTLFEEMGVIVGHEPQGEPIYKEEYLCAAPQERLFLHGAWHDGLFPWAAATRRDRDQMRAFHDRMAVFREMAGSDGRRAFAIPMELSSRDTALRALDRVSMHEWLAAQGLDSPLLLWFVDYACRDDFGLTLDQTSAWAGIHYHASRPVAAGLARDARAHVLTWPEGNGWLVRRLAAPLDSRIHTRHLVTSIAPERPEGPVRVDAIDLATERPVRWRASHVVCALPQFIGRRLLDGPAPRGLGDFSYSPWMVANLLVDRVPTGAGATPAWDNVLFDSDALGYVVATHQRLAYAPGPSVLTYYCPFPGPDPAASRRAMVARAWRDWRDDILTDLVRAHPDIAQRVARIDVMLWGHAMVRPHPGFLWGDARQTAARTEGPIVFAHTDLSGMALFEEAQYRGILAAEHVLGRMGHRVNSLL